LGFLHGHAFHILSGSGLDLDQWVSIKFGTLVLGVVVSVKGWFCGLIFFFFYNLVLGLRGWIWPKFRSCTMWGLCWLPFGFSLLSIGATLLFILQLWSIFSWWVSWLEIWQLLDIFDLICYVCFPFYLWVCFLFS